MVSESKKYNIMEENMHLVFSKVFTKYMIMKIRMKISYIALEKGKTILELFM